MSNHGFTPSIVTYGGHRSQYFEVWSSPSSGASDVAVLIHGGYWRERYSCDLMHPMASHLASVGWDVINLEYRRVGEVRDPWRAMAEDIETALISSLRDCDGQSVILVGHSAGGQLALWAASLRSLPVITGVVALAPVSDLRAADRLGLSNHAVRELLGDNEEQLGGRTREASPIELLPLGVAQLVVHGDADTDVPQELALAYVDAATSAGDSVDMFTPTGVDHFDIIDPTTDVWATTEAWMDDAVAAP